LSAKTEAIINDLMISIENISREKTSYFDAMATVLRLDGSTAWVHFDGGAIETPVKMTVGAKVGDEVMVRVANGYAYLLGNSTAPPTDDSVANNAQHTADYAVDQAIRATNAADIATRGAEIAAQAAENATTEARIAQQAASTAQASADAASVSAASANTSANNALTQLSTVEDVVGTLSWISSHGTYRETSDTVAEPGKFYFTRSGSGTEADPYAYAVVTDPADNPTEAGYYELESIDEAVSNYVSTHLALTNEGLFITLDDNGYKLKLTNSGAYIIDPAGGEVAEYSTVTNIGSSNGRHVHIDDDSVDIMDGTTSLASFGSTTIIGNQNGAHLEASGDRLSFKDKDGNEVAYVAVDSETNESIFYMTKAIVVKDLYFGNWRWNSRSNNNLALMWVGNTEQE